VIELVAQSEAMRACQQVAERVAPSEANILVTGESGAGKDALALFIHSRSARAGQSFLKIDCAALPGDLLEAELFGYERGAFTGAIEGRPGRLEAAHGGTLVLDEVAHLSTDAQAKLLRVIERREFERLGGRKVIRVDARLVALTNVDLDEAVRHRRFREDLFYRLNVVHIRVPPLRERREDVEPLAQYFVRAFAAKHGRSLKAVSRDALALLRAYEFPGNVRELANIVERAAIISTGERIELADLPEAVRAAAQLSRRGGRKLRTLAELEADYIGEVLKLVRGNKSEAARILGISRKNLYEKLARYKNASANHLGREDEE
jgi:DNA-binding NtrC family response regulator